MGGGILFASSMIALIIYLMGSAIMVSTHLTEMKAELESQSSTIDSIVKKNDKRMDNQSFSDSLEDILFNIFFYHICSPLFAALTIFFGSLIYWFIKSKVFNYSTQTRRMIFSRHNSELCKELQRLFIITIGTFWIFGSLYITRFF